MKLYIARNVLWGLVISITTIIGLGILSYSYFINLSAATQWTNHARRVLQDIEEVRSTLVAIENAQRGFSITGDESFLKPFEASITNLNIAVQELDSLTRDNQGQQSRIADLNLIIGKQLDYTRNVIDARKISFDSALALIQTKSGVNNMANVQQALNDLKQEEQGLLLSRSLGVQRGFYQFVIAFLGLLFVTVLVLLALVWLINSHTRSREIAEQRLRHAEAETKKINADLESFSYSVSHDLRAPLRSINGYAQILIEDYSDKFDEEGNRLLNVIINNAKRMGQLIDDLLEFSRLGRKEIQRASINVDEEVRTLASELLEREGHRKIELAIQPLGSALADPNMMRQVWINLLGNAIKYSNKKDLATIEVGRFEEKGEVVFFIKDNGAGFDMAYMDKLFGVFQRLHKNNEFEGTGVGLALVKRIVDRHKGRIWAEAKVDQGATFYFSLPLV